jgi:hypothetical protein
MLREQLSCPIIPAGQGPYHSLLRNIPPRDAIVSVLHFGYVSDQNIHARPLLKSRRTGNGWSFPFKM